MTASDGQTRVLLVEDDPDDFQLIREMVAEIPGTPIQLERVGDFDAGRAALSACAHNAYLVDYRLGKGTGLDLLEEAVRLGCQAPLIFVTGEGDRELGLRALKAGAADYLVKGQFDAGVLERSIRYSIERHSHTRELEQRVRERTAGLRDAQRRWRSALEAAELGAWNIDPAASTLESDERFRVIFHGSTAPITYEQAFAAIHPEDRERIRKKVGEATRPDNPAPYSEEYRVVHPDGTVLWVLGQGRATFEVTGTGRRMVSFDGTLSDITQQRELKQRLAEQAEHIAAESRRKDEFLAMLSHELRNPLAPIRAAVQLMRARERGTEDMISKQAREIIERQVGNLTRLVSDLLEVSRVLSGRIRLDRQVVDLNQIIQHAVETAAPMVEQHKHTLIVNRASSPTWTSADSTRIEEVFINLLNNAAKYTPDGGKIEVWCGPSANAEEAEIRIRDSGIGIEQELLPRIFDLFTQADRSLARSGGGLGIGLSLARRIVELHGGTIEAQSPPPAADGGSEFAVRLKLAGAPPALPETESSPAPTENAGRRVLVVDDNLDLVLMLTTSLRHAGYSVQAAYTGPDGLRVAQQWRPDVVLLDIGLPGLDGYEIARRLRADPRLGVSGGSMRLIALTGYGRDADLDQARKVGFDGHMTKPVDFKDLEKMMAAPTL